MRAFKDSLGRNRELVITVATLKTVRDTLGVDLWRAFDDEAKVLQELLGDPINFTETVYLLCGGKPKDEQAEADFCRGVDGDTLAAMERAFREELIEFYPPPKRPLLRRMVEKGEELAASIQKQADEQINRLTPEVVLERMGGGKPSRGASLASSESTPGPSPSAS